MHRMSEEEILEAFEDAGAILKGHFVLTSGRHSDTYVQCARVLEDTELTSRLAMNLAARLGDRQIDLVAAPAVGGIVIGFAVAQALGVKLIFSERQDGKMTFRRGFEVPKGARVLVAEDVVTTGGSVKEVIDLVTETGGIIEGAVSLIDRGGAKKFSGDYWPLLRLEVESWDASECGLCAQNVATTSPGSRRL